jgi:hypothetical protein
LTNLTAIQFHSTWTSNTGADEFLHDIVNKYSSTLTDSAAKVKGFCVAGWEITPGGRLGASK